MPDLDYSILGPLTVRHLPGGDVIPLADKPELLLARLLLEPGQRVPADRLLEDVWQGQSTKKNTVQQTVARLRERLGDAEVIDYASGGYRIHAPHPAIDARRFAQLTRRGRELVAARPRAALAMLEEALASWRGPLLGGCADLPWAQGAARELATLYDNAEVDLNEARLALGDHDEVEVAVRRQLAAHELDERRHQQLIRALLLAGRDAEATQAYLTACRRLGTPGPDLRAIGERLGRRRRDPARAHMADSSRPSGMADRWVILHVVTEAEAWDRSPTGSVVLTIEQAGGAAHPVTTDEITGVFSTPETAARAALSLIGDPRLRCRIGVHTGATVHLGDRLLGPGPARCRVLAHAAHADQVLVSAAARGTGWDGVELIPLGEQRYEDLLNSEEVFELATPGRPHKPRLPRTLSRHPNNLPIQSSRFVGRSRELADVSRLVAPGELITLTGPGGSGKTRLALQLAARRIAAFADGAWFVGLADVRDGADPETVATAIASALRARSVAGETATDALQRHLSDRSALLVLDNCEHVAPACAELIATLRPRAPGTCVIATSIKPIGLDTERIIEVPPMATTPKDEAGELPDAVELLLERAGYLPSIDDRDEALVGEAARICALLDGLPLAIELAAGQVAQRGIAGLADEISSMLEGRDDLRSLASHDPTRAARHMTIDATIAWGHRLLTARQQTVFRRLAVFRGSFGLDEARAVAGGGHDETSRDISDVIWALVHCSMVAPQPPLDGQPRLRLRSPIRAYALERLREAGEEADVRARHTAVYHELAIRRAPQLFGGDEDRTLRAFAADHDNFRAALSCLIEERRAEDAHRLASALWWMWFSHGHFEEGGVWIDAALQLDAHPSRTVVRSLRAASHLSWWRGAYDATREYNERLEASARAIDDAWGLAWAPMGHGAVLMFPHPELALPQLAESRARFSAINCAWEAGYALMLIGGAHWFAGDTVLARQAYGDAARIFERLRHRSVLASARRGEGLMTALTGDRELGAALCHDALAFSESIGDRGGSAQALNFLAVIARDAGELDLVAERHAAALSYAREVGELWATCAALDGIAAVARADGKAILATQLLACSAAIAASAGFGPPRFERELRDSELTALRARLAGHEFSEASRRGAGMSIADAVGAALAFTRDYSG